MSGSLLSGAGNERGGEGESRTTVHGGLDSAFLQIVR